ncbi:MAG: hypothetical protein HY056_14350 [Proteobacteria bacterium]|nr:hypothetical protein [Pseudomonadota bacterium]
MTQFPTSQEEPRVIAFPVRVTRPGAGRTVFIAAGKRGRMCFDRLGTFGFILLTLATAGLTAVVPLMLLSAFLVWCAIMATLTAIDLISERINARAAEAAMRDTLDHSPAG